MEKPKCLSQHLEASMLWAGAEKILSIPGARTPQPLHSHKTGLGSHGGNPCQLSMPACWCHVGWRLWVLGLHTAPRAFCTAVGWELLLSELIPLAGGVRMKCSGWQVWRHNYQWIVPCKDHKQDLKKTAASPDIWACIKCHTYFTSSVSLCLSVNHRTQLVLSWPTLFFWVITFQAEDLSFGVVWCWKIKQMMDESWNIRPWVRGKGLWFIAILCSCS